MEASCIFCGGVSTSLLKSPGLRRRPSESISLYRHKNLVFLASPISHRVWASANNSRSSSSSSSATKRRSRKNREDAGGTDVTSKNTNNKAAVSEETRKKLLKVNDQENGPRSVRALYQNGDPLGRRELGKGVVKWICQGMKAMALDFAMVEMQGDFAELKQRMGPGLTFVIQAQPYLNAVPMPIGLEAICLKTCTHYPTLFDHFQRELRDVLQDLQRKTLIHNWRETESWKLLKELASSAQHRAIARKTSLTKSVHGVLGLELVKAKAMQCKIDEFTKQMSDLLRIERDAELEFTQDELNAVPTPDDLSSSSKPIEFLVSHAQAEQELCDTICNLNAISTSTGLGGMHLVLFRVERNHRLPPLTFSRRHGLISVALESRHGDPTFSKLFGKSIRIDRIQGLADAITYERNCEALMMLQKKGLQKKNSSRAVVTTIFGDKEDITRFEGNNLVDWSEVELSGLIDTKFYDSSQQRAIALGLNKKRPVLIIQGPPGTGKTGVLKQLISLVVKQGERVLVTAPTNAAVDNMVEKLSEIGANIVRVGNPARISPTVASKSLVEIVNTRLGDFRSEFERKKSDLRKDQLLLKR
ncbi:UNVERIFIED_CONTAM: DNA-binding protein SMUBP-2 [Sesamum calycinum]|uniref:DNA-binding protein SMUBP-2 n=1 Tax=Sesamum calycinum TaxID=2727403 RepID=A0AAW2L3C0_9LAMI